MNKKEKISFQLEPDLRERFKDLEHGDQSIIFSNLIRSFCDLWDMYPEAPRFAKAGFIKIKFEVPNAEKNSH